MAPLRRHKGAKRVLRGRMMRELEQKKVYEKAIKNWPKDDRLREKLLKKGSIHISRSDLSGSAEKMTSNQLVSMPKSSVRKTIPTMSKIS